MQTVTGTLTINFNANGGYNPPSTTLYEYIDDNLSTHTVTLPSGKPSRSGYTFKGWSLSSSASSPSYYAGGAYSWLVKASTPDPTVTLYAVWGARPSTISVSGDGILGHAQAITVTRYNSSFTHTVSYSWAGATGDIVSNSSETSISWTPDLSLANNLTDASHATCTLSCRTYNGSSLVGTTSTTLDLWVAGYQKLRIDSVTLAEAVAAVSSNFSGYVQGRSKVRFMTALDTANAYGATLRSCTVQFNDQTLSGTDVTSNLLSGYGTLSYLVTITDTRGRTDTESGTVSVFQYSAPTVGVATVGRRDATPTSVDIAYSWTVSSVNSENAKHVRIRYKLVSAAGYTTALNTDLATYSGNDTYTITGLSASDAYDLVIEVSDTFATVSYSVQILAQGNRYIECSANDGTISFNGANPEDGWNHFYKPTWFDSDVHIDLNMATPATIGGILFDCGTIAERSVASATHTSENITFAVAFPTPPVVIASITSSEVPNVGNCTASIVSVSTTGCTIKLNNAASADRTIGASWFAVANGRNSNLVGYGVVGTMQIG